MLSPKLRHRSSIFSLFINHLITLTILLHSPLLALFLAIDDTWCSRLVELALFNRTKKKRERESESESKSESERERDREKERKTERKRENKLEIRTSKNWLEIKTETTRCRVPVAPNLQQSLARTSAELSFAGIRSKYATYARNDQFRNGINKFSTEKFQISTTLMP